MNKVKNIGRDIGKAMASPFTSALAQTNWLTAAISTYFSGLYQQEQMEALTTLAHLLNEKVRNIEESKIDKEFFESDIGKRTIGKIFKSVVRDNRIDKIRAMSCLTTNLYTKNKLTFDERELFVDILDTLNYLQLSILQKAVIEMRTRTAKHRGFGWEEYEKEFQDKGISKSLLLQSIRVLESNGLINENNATIVEKDKTHFITEFGEVFYDFISMEKLSESYYL
jgi:hypothetical protein